MALPAETDPRRCKAHSSRTGMRCQKWAIRGGSVCEVHGGSAPAVKAAARRRLEERRVKTELGQMLHQLENESMDRPPEEILAEQLYRAQAMVAVLGVLVAKLEEEGLHGPDHLGDGRPHVVTSMYAEWVERTGKLAKLAVDVGLEGKRHDWQEGALNQVAAVLNNTMAMVFAYLERHGVEADWLHKVREHEVPAMFQQAIEATARESQ